MILDQYGRPLGPAPWKTSFGGVPEWLAAELVKVYQRPSVWEDLCRVLYGPDNKPTPSRLGKEIKFTRYEEV